MIKGTLTKYINSFIPRTLEHQVLDCILGVGRLMWEKEVIPEMTLNVHERLTGEADVGTN